MAKDRKRAHESEEVEFEETYLTRGQLVWRAFKRHKLGVGGLVVLVIMYFIAIFADFLAPYNPYEQSLIHKLASPTKVHREYKGQKVKPYVLPTVSFIDPFTSKDTRYEMLFPYRLVFSGKEYGVYPDKVVIAGEEREISKDEKISLNLRLKKRIHVFKKGGEEVVLESVENTPYLLIGYDSDVLERGSVEIDLNTPTAKESLLKRVEFRKFRSKLSSAGIRSEEDIEDLKLEILLDGFVITSTEGGSFSMPLEEFLKGYPEKKRKEIVKKIESANSRSDKTPQEKFEIKSRILQSALLQQLMIYRNDLLRKKLIERFGLDEKSLKDPMNLAKLMKSFKFREEDGEVTVEMFKVVELANVETGGKGVEDYDYRTYRFKWFVKSWKGKLLWLFPLEYRLFGVEVPEGDPAGKFVKYFFMGADLYGRDQWSRIVFASRISLSIGLIGMAITFGLALIFGGISGYYGGIVDEIMMRIAEIIMSIPGFYLLILLRSLLPMDIPSTQIYVLLVFILSFIGWAGTSRVIRGMVLSIRQREFVEAAIVIGLPDFKVLTRHVLPNTTSFLIVAATLRIPGYILGEAGLSYLGLGIREPDASWGLMLAQAQDVYIMQTAPWLLIPGAFIFATVLAFNFLGDALRDALDPRSLG